MNHIARLTQERDDAQARVLQLEHQLIDLQQYLASSKFHAEDWVSAREMWNRVQSIRCDYGSDQA